ncbi:hypothetical protein M9434_004394 [Picochlorum sp. BPE23]|nr:hypothetical protein M9434_004394 [Picochlorum sp. BPE23]
MFDSLKSPHDVAIVAIAVLLGSFLLNLFERFAFEWKVPDTRGIEMDLTRSIEDLKKEAAKLMTPETFAASAKAERKAIALEKELDTMRRNRAIAGMHYMVRLPRTMRMVLFVGAMFVALTGHTKVVCFMDPSTLWPLGRWLSLLSGHGASDGVIGLIPWCILCHRVTKSLVSSENK